MDSLAAPLFVCSLTLPTNNLGRICLVKQMLGFRKSSVILLRWPHEKGRMTQNWGTTSLAWREPRQ